MQGKLFLSADMNARFSVLNNLEVEGVGIFTM